MKFGRACNSHLVPRNRRDCSAFTLAEILAALLFMAIVIPAAVEALHLAGVSGMIAVRKANAVRVADDILNQSVASTNWFQAQSGDVTQDGHTYHWTLRNEAWAADSGLQLVTAEVNFSAQGRDYSVRLSTLANPVMQSSSMPSQ